MDDELSLTDETDAPEPRGDVAAALADEAVRGRYGEPWNGRARVADSGEVEAETVAADPADGADEDKSGSGRIVGHLQNVAEPFADHIVAPVAGAIGSMLDAAGVAWRLRESAVERRLKRQAKEPLLNLYEAYPEARLASPRELGPRFVPVEEILGTAVAGIAQRGGDFLPLKPFRGENWAGRWQRIRDANELLQPLPPVDLIKFGGEYWVVDGHNRVAATLYANGVGLDAMVTELVPLDGRISERPTSLSSYLRDGDQLRAAVSGLKPAFGMRQSEFQPTVGSAGLAGTEADPEALPDARLVPDDGGTTSRGDR
jgi:hypothetical protein